MQLNKCQYPLIIYLNVEKVIVNEVIQEKNGNFLEIYDLQGLRLTCISKSFPPFLLIYGCTQNGKNCRTSGGFNVGFMQLPFILSNWNIGEILPFLV